jgi:LPPG:FO 2-phospho-L-lactate transferase
MYTLAGINDAAQGWGIAGETWNFMQALEQLGGEIWFRLGDRDLALHVVRTQALRAGKTLSEFAASTAARLGIAARIVPMTDDSVRTIVDTAEGSLPFQRYFVERRCEPAVTAIEFEGADAARPAEGATAALTRPDLAAVIVCPSNPYLSVDPILAVPGLRSLLRSTAAPVVAVSPIIGGRAVKGPTAKIMAELGIAATHQAIARHYGDVLDGLVIDAADAGEASSIPCAVEIAPTLMRSLADREQLARRVMSFAARLRSERSHADEGRRAAHG